MNNEEYYNRLNKITSKISSDRVSKDEEYNLICQKNYLATKYIESLEQENNQLKENNQAMQEEMCRTWEKLNIIKELRSWLEEMLDDEKDIFSVVRVKDVLSKLNELEGGKNE